MCDEISNFFQECKVFLQDPLHCEFNVPYRNPHRLSGLDEEFSMTQDMHKEQEIKIEEAPE